MDLILWRHADAEDGAPDDGRKLTKKGLKQAAQMAAWLKLRLPNDTRILVSPALRAQQTAQALDMDFKTSKALAPGVQAVSVLAAAGWPDGGGTVLVVGHQPTLGQVAALLLAGEEAGWNIKKAAIWWFTNRVRQDENQVVLRAVMSPEFVQE